MNPIVELEGVNGEWFNLTTGDRGVYLDTGVTGIYDAPVKAVYEEPGNFPGARYLNHRILRRDIVFGVVILNDKKTTGSWMSRDSEWRKAWAFDRDCKLWITTEESGPRYLKLRLLESPEISLEVDPNSKNLNQVAMTCVSGDPFWYQADVVYSALTSNDTTFDPNPLPWPWPQELIPTETLTITVDPSDGLGGLNPTDQAVFGKWTVPGSTEAPAEPYIPGLAWLGAPNSPATIWTLPDYSYQTEDEVAQPDVIDLRNRRLRLPGLIGGLRTEEVQALFIGGKPTGGTFTLTFGAETTAGIAYNASTAAVKAALVALAGIALNDVSIVRDGAVNEVQTVTIDGGPTGGTFTLTFNGETTTAIPYNAPAGTVKNALIALASVGNSDVSVTALATNEVQSIQIVGEPTAGTFTLTFQGQTTIPIPWNANSYTVASALRGLSNIVDGGPFGLFFPSDVIVTQATGGFQPFKVAFQGAQAGLDVGEITADPTLLTGGAGIDVVVTTETEGSRIYICTFAGNLSGFDFPTMTGNPAGLTGGDTPTIVATTSVDGRRPYLITFTGALSGIDVPLMTANGAGLTGPGTLTASVVISREGATAPAENCIVDSDPRVEQVVSESGSQVWSRMNGVRFRHPIPPYTRDKEFEITVSGCVPGQMVTLRIPRPWSRPWGLEA